MRFEYNSLTSLERKNRAILFIIFFIVIASAIINSASILLSGVPIINRITGLICQVIFAYAVVFSILTIAIVHNRMGKSGYTLISGTEMGTVIAFIVILCAINVIMALYAIITGGINPAASRGFFYAILSPVLFSFTDSYIYSDQDYLFIGMRKMTVPLKKIAKVDITPRKLGLGYIITLMDCRGERRKLNANELLKDKFIEFIGKYDAGITIIA